MLILRSNGFLATVGSHFHDYQAIMTVFLFLIHCICLFSLYPSERKSPV